jgi:hypothetical protein
MLSNWAIKKLEHLTLDYMKLDCAEGSCYGVMGVSVTQRVLPQDR